MIETVIIEGLIYSLMVMGLFISYRTLNFCDMTIDGAFPMGACIFGSCLLAGINPVLALLFSFIGGLCAGLCTTIIYTKLKIPDLLSGILMMIMLYSVNLRITHDVSNVSYLRLPNPFEQIKALSLKLLPALPEETGIMIVMIVAIVLFKILIDVFFHTDLGLTMGALGDNQQMVISLGVNPTIVRGLGICFCDGLTAVCGALMSMYAGSANVGSGNGVIVSGLASLMLGEFVIRSNKIEMQTLRVIIGSILYRGLMMLARSYGYLINLKASDLNLITGLLIIACLIISRRKVSFKNVNLPIINSLKRK